MIDGEERGVASHDAALPVNDLRANPAASRSISRNADPGRAVAFQEIGFQEIVQHHEDEKREQQRREREPGAVPRARSARAAGSRRPSIASAKPTPPMVTKQLQIAVMAVRDRSAPSCRSHNCAAARARRCRRRCRSPRPAGMIADEGEFGLPDFGAAGEFGGVFEHVGDQIGIGIHGDRRHAISEQCRARRVTMTRSMSAAPCQAIDADPSRAPPATGHARTWNGS